MGEIIELKLTEDMVDVIEIVLLDSIRKYKSENQNNNVDKILKLTKVLTAIQIGKLYGGQDDNKKISKI